MVRKKLLSVKLLIVFLLFSNFALLLHFNPPIFDSLMHPPQYSYMESQEWELYNSQIKHGPHIQKVLNDDDYCARVALFQKSFPIDLDFNGLPAKSSRVVYSNFPNWYFVKKILSNYTNLVLVDYVDSNTNLLKMHLPENITFFFHMTADYHEGKVIDTQFLCPGQRYNHIPGNFYIDSKDINALDIAEYQKYFEDSPECQLDFFPYTLVLEKAEDCKKFINELKKSSDQQSIKWIYKKAQRSNQGRGVSIVDSSMSESLLKDYEKNSLCTPGYIAQEYLANPYLINSHKFDFRAYMVIASMSPLIVLYHDGFLRLTAAKFLSNATEPWRHMSNIRQAKIYLESSNFTQTAKKNIMDSLDMTFEEFQKYLDTQEEEIGDWFAEVFRPKAKEIILQVVRMNSKRLLKHPRVFEVFGIDFMMDENKKIWLIEVNTDPGIAEITKDMGDINVKFLLDLIELEYSLEYSPETFDEILSKTRFQYVYDERKFGMSRYHGLLSLKCVRP